MVDMTGNGMHYEHKPFKSKNKERVLNQPSPDDQSEFISHQKIMQEKMAQVIKKIQENKYANEEVFLWNVIQKNPDINLLEYQICYAPTYGEYRDEFGTLTTTTGQRWWLEKL